MADLRFLLIQPTSDRTRALRGRRLLADRLFQRPVLSCLYVAAAAPPWVQTQILDEDAHPIDFNADVDVVGLSFATANAPRAYEIAGRFRRRGIPVIMGGFHPTICPEDALRHADAVCIGEAENKMLRIMEDVRAGRLLGVYDGPPCDLAELPVPNRRMPGLWRRAPIDTILATRGCPHRCTFCSVTAFYRQTWRTRPIQQVVEELRTLRRRVLFVDDNLMVDRDYALELFAAIAPLGKRWYGQCSTSIARDPELLRRAADAGCRGLFMGFESLSEPNLRAWHKGFNRPQAYERLVKQCHDAGIGVFAGLVFGMDDDTPAVFRRTLQFLDDVKLDFAGANILTPFPGTPLFDEMESAGRIFDRDWAKYDFNHAVFEPRHMSPDTLERGACWVRAQFYGRRRIARRIMRATGYLDPATLVHMGIPINLGFRSRIARSGTTRVGLDFVPPSSESPEPRALSVPGLE